MKTFKLLLSLLLLIPGLSAQIAFAVDEPSNILLVMVDDMGYLASTAQHWPIQAHVSDVEKYFDAYSDGPDAVRQRRFERLRQIGFIPSSARLPELDPTVTNKAKRAKQETRDRWTRTYATTTGDTALS